MSGTLELTFNPALRSAITHKALLEYRDQLPHLCAWADLRTLDLETLDGLRRRKGTYVLASALQGATTAIAVTGTEVSTTVSGGATAATVVGALAVDTVASLAMMGRSVGSVAARYGYDVRSPDEELFAMGVLSLGMASSLEAKHAALGALSRLTQQMMRQATWKQLNEHALMRVIARAYELLGLSLTKRKLAQAVPFVGVALNASLSAYLTKSAYERAEDVYRLRFLAERYDIDPRDWQAGFHLEDTGPEADGQLPDVAEVLDEERNLGEGDLGDA